MNSHNTSTMIHGKTPKPTNSKIFRADVSDVGSIVFPSVDEQPLRPDRRGKPVCVRVIVPTIKGESSREPIVFLSQNGGMPTAHNFTTFNTTEIISYEPYCDDFGPLNALSIIQFVEILNDKIKQSKRTGISNIVYCAEAGKRALTNAAFLLGAYMILQQDKKPIDVLKCFKGFDPDSFEDFRDASFSKADFGLSLIDCWQGLERGKFRGWIGLPSESTGGAWGLVDKESYEHYENPLNADLHEVVPQKCIVFKGPKDLGGKEFCNNFKNGDFVNRDFSPSYFLDIFSVLGVSTIIRLNEAQYDESIFVEHGFDFHDLDLKGSVTPPPNMVSRFFKIIDDAPGTVAIHGGVSLGATGTMVALYLMRSYGFSAREAMGWLRIMRPGSVIGDQQHYLTNIEHTIRRRLAASTASAVLAPSAASSPALPPPSPSLRGEAGPAGEEPASVGPGLGDWRSGNLNLKDLARGRAGLSRLGGSETFGPERAVERASPARATQTLRRNGSAGQLVPSAAAASAGGSRGGGGGMRRSVSQPDQLNLLAADAASEQPPPLRAARGRPARPIAQVI